MKLIRKFALAIVGVAFALSLFVSSSNAQPGKARWQGNKGKHIGWTKGRHNGWYKKKNKWYRRPYRVGIITPRERLRLARERARIARASYRFSRDGIVTRQEARKLGKRYVKYDRKVYKAGRN